jgi:hypothetical protein
LSLVRDKKETKAQMKINKAFEKFSETLMSQDKFVDSQAIVAKLISKLHDQAVLSVAKHPAPTQESEE